MAPVFVLGTHDPVDHEVLTVGATKQILTASKYTITGAKEIQALITVKTDSIQCWFDGSDPTIVADGHVITPGSSITLYNRSQCAKFACTRVTGDAKISVTYSRR